MAWKIKEKQANAINQASCLHLAAAFPGTRIHCFALLRTISQGEIASILDPVAGRITYRQGHLHRDP